ncbi:MAG TPA: tRNA (guanosine(37)-N1)-methyltransferase TrmD [bacterium]|nr:tRNA (guanosine(37)-N1)-methyltransferase TrmD [bacterium]
MRIDVVTTFPDMLQGFLLESMMKRAQEKGIVTVHVWNLRDFTRDKHKTVDDYPYGGGAGMVMKPEPFFRAMDSIRKAAPETGPVIFPSPQGEVFNQDSAKSLSSEPRLIFLCGHYKGVDERVLDGLVTREISIGDYILTSGELAAAVMIDAAVRLKPGVLGDFDSAEGDSFQQDTLEGPQFTRPAEYRGMKVPEVLLSGNHAKVKQWRLEQRIKRTRERRPDLLSADQENHKKS